MEENATKLVIEAALLAAGRPLSFDKLVELFSRRGVDVDRAAIRSALNALQEDYTSRNIELKEVASGFRVQVRSSTRDWLDPLFEERAPRYTRALLETLALIAYRQPITRAEIEEIRGVSVSSNIVRTLIERGWVRVVGYRDVPGKPSMLGTTKEFLDYFGLRKLDDLPPLSEIRDLDAPTILQPDLVERIQEFQDGDAALIATVETDHDELTSNRVEGVAATNVEVVDSDAFDADGVDSEVFDAADSHADDAAAVATGTETAESVPDPSEAQVDVVAETDEVEGSAPAAENEPGESKVVGLVPVRSSGSGDAG